MSAGIIPVRALNLVEFLERILKTILNNVSSNPRRVLLIRHGVTEWMERGILNGSSDPPLSSYGLKQANLTAQSLQKEKEALLISSPMQRALQTSQAIQQTTGFPINTLEDLREMDFGWLEGKRDLWPILKNHPFWVKMYYVLRVMVSFFSGESFAQFNQRVQKTWRGLRESAGQQALIVVAHSGVLRVILMHEFGGKFNNATQFVVDTCSITEIEIKKEGPSKMIRMNDTKHLKRETAS